MLMTGNFEWNALSGAAHSGPRRIPTLNNETRDIAVKKKPIVETGIRQVDEVLSSDGNIGKKLDRKITLGRLDEELQVLRRTAGQHQPQKKNQAQFSQHASLREDD